MARLLGGGEPAGKKWRPRPVTIVDAGSKKQLEVRVEVPVDDLSKLGELEELDEPARRGIGQDGDAEAQHEQTRIKRPLRARSEIAG